MIEELAELVGDDVSVGNEVKGGLAELVLHFIHVDRQLVLPR